MAKRGPGRRRRHRPRRDCCHSPRRSFAYHSPAFITLKRRYTERRHLVSLRNVCECRVSIATRYIIFYYNISYMYIFIIYIILPDRWELIKNKKREKRETGSSIDYGERIPAARKLERVFSTEKTPREKKRACRRFDNSVQRVRRVLF